MNLDDNWGWKQRKLTCRVAPESGNPAGDELRARFAELAGKNLDEMHKMYDTLDMMKQTKQKKEKEHKGVFIDHKANKKFNQVLSRSHILGGTRLALDTIDTKEEFNATTVTQKNLKKQFNRLPVAPPSRILLEIQRERSKPATTIDTEDILAKQAKLEKRLEKQRQKRLLKMQAEENGDAGDAELASRFTKELMAETFTPMHNGDLFSTHGDYMQSMLYLSRMTGSLEKSDRIRNKDEETVFDTYISKKKEKSSNVKKDEEDENRTTFTNEGTSIDMNAKVYCAVSLCNWSRNPANSERLSQEGGVRAIMQLLGEHNSKLLRFCSAAFRFMSEHTVLANSMIEEGAVSAISDVVKVPVDDFASTNLAVALVNLTRINGKEAYLVEGSTVLALHNLILNKPDLSSLCARGLYNLTCVDSIYPLMERLIRVIITISGSNNSTVRHTCAAALCNLSDLKLMRTRLVEEGTVAVLGSIARHASTRTRRVCAVILQNLSATKSCRVEMVLRSSVHVAHNLSSDRDPIILRCVGLTLARLSTESANSARIVQEFGVSALCNIAMKFPGVPGISQPVSTAFQLLANQPTARVQVVQEGCVTSLAQFLHTSEDPFTLQNSLYALANLLLESENHLPIVQQGLILTLVNMSTNEDDVLKDLCALALFNLSCSEESRKHVVNAGAISSLIALTSQNSPITKQRCAHALCNVCAYEQGVARMVNEGIIPALVKLLSEDDVTIHYSCAALSRLCTSVENSKIILESGGVPSLVEGTIKGDTTTKQFCGSVLSALSSFDACKAPLCDLGAISALKSLAELNDDVSQQRCLVAFANMSYEESVRVRMVEEGVVACVAALIGNSYQEKNYVCCAKALCNLACSEGTRSKVAEEGGVHALLMISMVHSVDRHTKLLCVMALYNLLDEHTIDFMIEQNISSSIANLCKLDDDKVVHICSRMYNYLSKFNSAMENMTSKVSVTFNAIATMRWNENEETKMIAARTTANLSLCDNREVANAINNAGALEILTIGAGLDDYDAAMQCVAAIFSSCSEAKFRIFIAEKAMANTFLKIAQQRIYTEAMGPLCILLCKVIAIVTADEEARKPMQNSITMSLLASFADVCRNVECGKWIAVALSFLVEGYTEISPLLEIITPSLFVSLYELDDTSGVISKCLVQTLFTLISISDLFAECLASREMISVLRKALDQCKVSGDEQVYYNVSYVLFKLSDSTPIVRNAISCELCAEILTELLTKPACYEIATATVNNFYNDRAVRKSYALPKIGEALVRIIDSKPVLDCIFNCVSCIYVLSKIPETRDWLTQSPINADQTLLIHANSDDAKLKANVSRTMKNLASDGNEAIEEGTVAALIAISLEGKAQRTKVGDEVRTPVIKQPPPRELPDTGIATFDTSQYHWYCDKEVTIGGEVGDGPDHPAPPQMNQESDSSTYGRASLEELDSSEVEGKAKMSFAKMQIPREIKSMFLLADDDFNVKEDDETTYDDNTMAGEGVVPGGVMEGSITSGLGEDSQIFNASGIDGGASVESKQDNENSAIEENGSVVSGAESGDKSNKDTKKKTKKTKMNKAKAKTLEGGARKKASSPQNKTKPGTAGEMKTEEGTDMVGKAQQLGLYT